jgi:hypothetical protein
VSDSNFTPGADILGGPAEPKPEPEKPERPASTFSAAFAAVMEQFTGKISDGTQPKKLQRRVTTIVVDYLLCEPDVYSEDFKLTLEGLNSDAELAAIKAASDGASMGFVMAKKSVTHFNGKPLKAIERDVLWETLGFAGRVHVTDAFMKYCTGVGDGMSLGKSLGVELG